MIVRTGLAVGLIAICTSLLVIPINGVGYFNFGDAMIMFLSIRLNPALAFISAGMGSMLGDFIAGYPQYALFTLLIKGLEGFLISKLTNYSKLFRLIIGGCWMIFGYGLVDLLLYRNLVVIIPGIIANVIQVVVSILLVLLVWRMMR